MIEREPYLIALWDNGGYIRTDHWDFTPDFLAMVKQHGPPDQVEFRSGQPEQQTA